MNVLNPAYHFGGEGERGKRGRGEEGERGRGGEGERGKINNYYQLSIINDQLSITNYQLSITNSQLLTPNCTDVALLRLYTPNSLA